MDRTRGFTASEVLVVIAVVVVLVSLLAVAVRGAWMKSRCAQCDNNMMQVGVGLMLYRDDYIHTGRELNPLRLTHLYSLGYVKNEEVFICPLDNFAGAQGGKPNGRGITQYDELDGPVPPGPNPLNIN